MYEVIVFDRKLNRLHNTGFGKARKLLKKQKVKIIFLNPFAIQFITAVARMRV